MMAPLRPAHVHPLLLIAFVVSANPLSARADDAPVTVPPASSSATRAAGVPTAPPSGLAVLAAGDAAPVAWPLAQKIYATAALRPLALDEDRARVLAGEAPTASTSKELRELGELRAAVTGDDAPSRALLGTLARATNVRAIVVVDATEGQKPRGRVFVAESGAFDAATYAPDDAASLTWDGAVASLTRAFGMTPRVTTPGGALAPVSHDRAADGPHASHPFYASPWFWGAVGAAAFGAGAVYFATRDNGPDAIHLQMQVSK